MHQSRKTKKWSGILMKISSAVNEVYEIMMLLRMAYF